MRPRNAVAVAALPVLIAGCTGGSGDGVATASPTEAGRVTCSDLVHQGRHLGLTVPAGFAVTDQPKVGQDAAEAARVNVIGEAKSPANQPVPSVQILVFGYGTGERSGQSALEASVLAFKNAVGGSSSGDPIVATPTTIAGVAGTAGGGQDDRALDYTDPDSIPTPLRWWTVKVDEVQFVITMAARTDDLDSRYAPQVLDGLHPGGCPTASN